MSMVCIMCCGAKICGKDVDVKLACQPGARVVLCAATSSTNFRRVVRETSVAARKAACCYLAC